MISVFDEPALILNHYSHYLRYLSRLFIQTELIKLSPKQTLKKIKLDNKELKGCKTKNMTDKSFSTIRCFRYNPQYMQGSFVLKLSLRFCARTMSFSLLSVK